MERERKNILSMFAHDMKNPVLTSGGFIFRLLAGKAGNLSLKQKEYLTIMEDNLHRVERLMHLPKVFDAFFRVSRDLAGSRLGLAITKTIIEAHGGRIWVNSSTDKGTSFHFILPKKK